MSLVFPYDAFLEHSPQLTLNLALGIIFVLITLDVLIARAISSPANIPQAVCKGPGFESLKATFCLAKLVGLWHRHSPVHQVFNAYFLFSPHCKC